MTTGSTRSLKSASSGRTAIDLAAVVLSCLGPVRFVVNTSDSPEIDGLGQTLPQLGYVRDFKVGPYYVWRRSAFVEARRPR